MNSGVVGIGKDRKGKESAVRGEREKLNKSPLWFRQVERGQDIIKAKERKKGRCDKEAQKNGSNCS